MLVLADYIHPVHRARYRRSEAFIALSPGFSYCVIPQGGTCPNDALVTARYEAEMFEVWGNATDLELPARDGRFTLRSGLTNAMYIIDVLAEQPQWLDRLRQLSLNDADETVLSAFGIDSSVNCQAAVEARHGGSFLAPDAGGYAYFNVEHQNGVLNVISRSDHLLGVACHFATNREAERSNLAGRLAKMSPAPEKRE